MVFTAAQLTAFFTTADYLGLSARTAAALAAEGITDPADLAEFDKEGLDAIFRNLRKPPRALQGGAGRGAGAGGRGLSCAPGSPPWAACCCCRWPRA